MRIFLYTILFSILLYAKATPEQMLQQQVDYYKSKLPMQTTNFSTMVDVSAKNRNLIMTYEVHNIETNEVKKILHQAMIDELKNVCYTDSGRRVFYNDKSSMTHMFYDTSHNFIYMYSINMQNCEKLKSGKLSSDNQTNNKEVKNTTIHKDKNKTIVYTTGRYKVKQSDTEIKSRFKALQLAKSNATEEAGTIIQSKFSSYSDSDGADFSEYDLETISSSLIKTKILNEYQKNGYYFVEIKATVDTSHIEKYKKDFTTIKRKVKNNKNTNSKSNKLARKMANEIQVMLDQNNGKVKVVNSTYMTRVLSYRNSVSVYYVIEQEELIKSVMKQRDISYDEAYKSANSKEFIDNVRIVYPINYRNQYCNSKSTRQAIKDGVEIYSNISWSNGIPILSLSKVSEKICIEHKQNEQANNKLFQDTIVKYEKPKIGFEKDIELIQSKLPMRVDKITTLMSMVALEKKIIYRYSLNEMDGLTLQQLKENRELFKVNAIKMITSGLCNKEESKNVLKDGGIFEYIYMLDNLEYYIDFKITWKDCKNEK